MTKDEVIIEFIARDSQNSEYDWANISLGAERVGKARCKIGKDTLIIFSINIFAEYAGNGYGKLFVETAKERYKTIIADKVRYTAIGFWSKLDFKNLGNENWAYTKE